MTTAMSLADFTSIIFSALSTVIWVPALKPILDGACATALLETVSRVCGVMRPSRSARNVT